MSLDVLEKYLQQPFAITRHHIDSYEQCVFDEIPSIIHSTNPLVFLKEQIADGVFAYRVEIFIGGDVQRPEDLAISVSPPVVVLDGGQTVRRMFPNEARLRNLTYYAQFNADILIRITFTRRDEAGALITEVKEAPVISGFPLFRLPILLRSKLCATGVADPIRLREMGECYNDYGGYFVIGGAEKVLITREEQAFNSLYVVKKPDGDDNLAYAAVVSLHPETKQTRRVAIFVLKTGEIRVSVPMVRGAIPVFILFRALGLETDEDIVRFIFPEASELEESLVPSIHDAYPIMNRYLAIKYIMTLTKGFTEAHVLDILQNLLLPHVPDEPLARALYLAEMVRASLNVIEGKIPNTNRDDMRNQRFSSTGPLLRELFNACWKDWRAEVMLTIDRTYRRNEQMYKGDSVFELFAAGNLMNMFQPATLNNLIMRGFKGRWGTNERNTKAGVLQPLARISYLDAMSHTRRVVSDFDTGSKATGPRKLHTSQVGYFCTSETPTGGHIGVTKNMSIMTRFSLSMPSTKPVYDWLRLKGGMIPVASTTASIRATASTVQINGGTVGFTLDPNGLVKTLRLLKWTACLSPSASISFNTTDKTVRIYVDEGRPIRPLWHNRLDGDVSWPSLVFGTLPATKGASLMTTRFLDPLADKPAATFADYEAALRPHIGSIEYCDPMEMNEAYVAWTPEEQTEAHTHCELHPSTMQGLLASMIPFSNHNQAPRNQLSCSQSKQGIGYMATNIGYRYGTYEHQLCYGEAPICQTMYYSTIAGGEMPYGFNCVIAATSETGYNQDDGLIINRDSVARGMFQSLAFRTYDCPEEVDSLTKVHSHVANPGAVPSWTSLRPGLDYSKLDDRGIIREGEIVDDSTVLVGRYMVVPDTNEIKDASVRPGLHTQGRVDSVVVLHQNEGRLLVKVRIIEMRMPGLGDKFSSRHGQKGTIGMLVSSADLPRTAEGLVPDVMVNPGGLISRMTVAQLVEMVSGKAAVLAGATMNATAFCNGGDFVRQLGDMLTGLGADRAGDEILYSGISGKQIQTAIFMCPLYFMRLKHLTEDKVNSRGEGRKEVRTHQPTGGRANEGGLRIGEMERDSLCAHGVSTFLQESMMVRGDGTEFWICNGCGRIPIYNEAEKLFVCSTCDGPITFSGLNADTMTLQLPTNQSRATFTKVAMPYAMKLLDQELTTFANSGCRFLTESSIGRLKETGWDWPTMDIAFRAQDRGIEAEPLDATAVAKPVRKKGGAVSRAKDVAGKEGGDELVAVANPAVFEFRADSVLSNLALAPFRISGKQIAAPDGTQYPAPDAQTWPSVEHYYQAMKFPTEPEWQEQIRQAKTSVRAKKMGTSPDHALRGDWDLIKDRVMRAALLEKFRQNPSMLATLQSTGEKPIVYASPGDQYWGAKGSKGLNRLGKLLDEVRAELKDMRPDLAQVQAAGPEQVVAEAQEVVAVAQNGVAQALNGAPQALNGAPQALNGAPQALAGSPQAGGVYLFINSAVGNDVEAKSRRARDPGPRRSISWAEPSVSQEGGGSDGSQLAIDTGVKTEVSVEKLG
jgi:DNA-directed RNA polymerase II subunit RPB2